MYKRQNVYLRKETTQQRLDAKKIVEVLVEYFKNNPEKLPSSYLQKQSEIHNAVDYVAGMTDRFAISTYNSIH